jgi:DNA invertase Pin-like site-specific DNA recombinase
MDDFNNPGKVVKVALYARVSTRDGRQFTENQVSEMRQYAERQYRWRIVGEYIDRVTGSRGIEGRDELARLMRDADAKKFDLVLVFALDRFTREGVLKAFQYVERLTASGIQFRSVTEEHFQTSGPAGELFMAVAAWMAKQERAQLRNRINAGLDRARAAGKQLGRPRCGVDISKVLALHQDGFSIRRIAAALKTSNSTVERILRAERNRPQVVEFPKAAGE